MNVAISSQFLSWIISFGSLAEILSSNSVVKQLYNLLKESNKVYKGAEKNEKIICDYVSVVPGFIIGRMRQKNDSQFVLWR